MTPAAEVVLPAGVVTFLFTDIEGSTKLLQNVGDRYESILRAHHAVIRRATAAHDGHEVDVAGDGFFLAFARASDAIEAAIDAQRGLADEPAFDGQDVRVRMGIHTGEAQVLGRDYLGLAVHHAARVAGAAHGGQVLISDATAALIEDARVDLLDLGEFHLKDLARPVRLFQVTGAGLPTGFPPVRALDSRPNNLPAFRTSFVGRDSEMEQLRELLADPGLLTLTGPGGCGKTRLAAEVARAALGTLTGGAWFVDLRDATEPADVAPAVAGALDVLDGTAVDDPTERVVAFIGDADSLLLLDNCEHLVAACADVADALLAACPRLRVIATSRDLLGVAGETAFRVPSLAFPGERDPLDEPLAYSAIRLFADRARRSDSRFEIGDDNAADVSRICRRLDGIPLAIELAAARVRHMGAAALERRLDDMFRVLVGSGRRSLQRHHTLDAVVGWSYELLDERDRALLRRLSVFAGGFTLDAGAAVCTEDPSDEDDVADRVFRLVDQSLVERVQDDRYRLLEIIRAYGHERLRDHGESDTVRALHLAYFVDVASALGATLRGGDISALDTFEAEVDNLRAALDWATGAEQLDEALQLIANMSWFFAITGRWAEVQPLVDHALSAAGGTIEPRLRARAIAGVALSGTAALDAGSLDRAVAAIAEFEALGNEPDEFFGYALLAEATRHAIGLLAGGPAGADAPAARALAMARAHGWPTLEAMAIAVDGWGRARRSDLAGGRARLAEALEIARRHQSNTVLGTILFWSGLMSMHAADWAAARAFYEESMPHFRRFSYKLWLQWELDHVAGACIEMGDLVAARSYAEEGLAVSKAYGLVGMGNYADLLRTVGVIEHDLGNFDQAKLYLRESLELKRARGRPHFIAAGLLDLAQVEADSDAVQDAARLCLEAIAILRDLEPVELESGATMQPPIGAALDSAAALASHAADPDGAAELLGASDAWRRSLKDNVSGRAKLRRNRLIDSVTAAIGRGAYGAASERGAELNAPLDVAEDVLRRIVDS